VAVDDLDVRALLLLMVDRQAFEPVTVDRAVRGGAGLREALADALGKAGDPRGRTMLEGLLIDPEAPVRRAAAFGLGELEDAAAVPALLKAARDADRETGVLAVEALGKLGARVVDVAEQLLVMPEEERWARLLPHLFRFKDEAKVALAERGLERPEPELHARAAYALGRDALPAAAPALRGLLADPEPWIRSWGARGLGSVGAPEDLPRLRPLLDGADASPIVQALRAAQRLITEKQAAPPSDWVPRLVELIGDPRPGVRVTALEAAGAWPAEGALGEAVAARAATGSGREREVALVAAAAAGHPRAGALVAAAAAESDPVLRARAAEGAGELVKAQAHVGGELASPRAEASSAPTQPSSGQGIPGAAEPSSAEEPGTGGSRGEAPTAGGLLDRLVTDAVPMVRAAAFVARLGVAMEDGGSAEGAGGEAAAAARRAAPLAQAALADPDPGVRAAAFDWLSTHPVVPLAALQPALRPALADREVESGLAAVAALAARGKAEPLERGAVVALLEQIAAGRDGLLRRAAATGLVTLERPAPAPRPFDTGRALETYREMVQRTRQPRLVELVTGRGSIRLELACPQAPLTCLNFLQLAAQGYFDGGVFHRVVPDFVVQGGDPRGDGLGGPGYAIRDEINRLRYRRGAVGMALAGPDTGGSQFFIALTPQPHLDGGYTVFGAVVAGMEVADQLLQGDRIERVREVP
jgi:cyclophilin family peptidyl-prolyl cis-trans isomerase/HEAT repeat protein